MILVGPVLKNALRQKCYLRLTTELYTGGAEAAGRGKQVSQFHTDLL